MSRILRFTLVAVALCAGAPGPALAADCQELSGPVSGFTYFPNDCTSVIGQCQHGTLEGGPLDGYDFTFATLAPAPDAAHPTRFHYTGTSVFAAGNAEVTAATRATST